MSAPVGVTRTDLSAAELRMAAGATRDARVARRLLALAMVLEGMDRAAAARLCGMDRQTLRDWVHRYNEEGIEGLDNRPLPGRPSRLTPAQREIVAGWIRDGSELDRDGVIRWRRIDVKRRMEAEFGATLSEQSVGKLLRRLGFSRISVRPCHPKHDTDAQEAHKKTLPTWLRPPSHQPPVAGPSRFGGRTKHASASKAA